MSRERGRIGFFVTDLALGHVLKKYNKKNPNSGMPAFDKGIKEIFSSLIKPFSPINENISSYMILESGSHDITRTARENSLVGQDLHKEDKIVGEIPPSLESIPGQIAFEDSKVRNSESFQISDGNRFASLPCTTFGFTRMVTYTGKHGSNRIIFFNNFKSFFVFPMSDKCDIN